MSVLIRPYTKRGKSGWEVDIVLKMPNGDVLRQRVKSPVTSKSGTKFWAEQREAELLKNGIRRVELAVPTFCDFFERFISGHCVANRHKPSGIDSKRRAWKNYLLPRFGKLKMDKLTAESVQLFKGAMAAENLSAKTVNNALSLLNGILKAAHEWGLLKDLPVRIRMLNVKQADVEFYEPSQLERLVVAARRMGPRAEAVVLLGGEAGLRSGEMQALRWIDIDFDRKILNVRLSFWRGHTTLPKSGKPRSVPMTNRLADCLKSQRHLIREQVLYGEEGRQATQSCLNKMLMQAERRAGLEAVGSLKRLRHTFCSRLARNGAPAAAIQALAGHASYATTARYVHLFIGAKESAIQLLEPLNFGDMLETDSKQGAQGAS